VPNASHSIYAIKAEGISKSFGDYQALKGIDLEVAEGESVVIFGPNGAGKSTLIRVLATIMRPSSGEVLINGLNIKNQPEAVRRRIGVIAHQTFLYANLTGYENLEFYSRMYDVPAYRERIKGVAETVGMTHRLHDRVGTLSRGMQQRLAIARALLHKPAIMLMDEPETGLDQQAVSILWNTLKSQENGKRTIILTTHNLERGLELCDRVLILNMGRIAYEKRGRDINAVELKQAYEYCTGAKA